MTDHWTFRLIPNSMTKTAESPLSSLSESALFLFDFKSPSKSETETFLNWTLKMFLISNFENISGSDFEHVSGSDIESVSDL